MNSLDSGLRQAAMLAGSVSGYVGLTVLPLWAGAVVVDFGLAEKDVGWIGSLQLGAAAIGSVLVAKALGHVRWKTLALAAAALVVLANIGSAATQSVLVLCLCRMASGLAEGALLSSINAWIARSPGPERLFAASQMVLGLLSVLIFFCVPLLMRDWGAAGVFGTLAAIGTVSFLLVALAMPADLGSEAGSAGTAARIPASGRFGLLILGSMFVGIQGVWLYLERMGVAVGYTTQGVGGLLAMGALAAVIGPAIIHRVGTRFGHMLPVAIGMSALTLAVLLVTVPGDRTAFAIGAVPIQTIVLFNIATAMGLLAALDPSGRTAAAAPIFINVGSAIGPSLASLVIGFGGYGWIGGYATLLFLAAIQLARTAIGRKRREEGRPAPALSSR